MPIRKQHFKELYNNLQKQVDVDDSSGRSVPINMNFSEVGYISKDTGSSLYGATETTACHSLFNYKKKDGTSYLIRANDTKLQQYNTSTGVWDNLSPTYTAGAKFGFIIYEDLLYGGNGVEATFTWDGTTFTNLTAAPKGNILEIFEDKLFISGVTAEPLTTYYSNTGDFTLWTSTDILQPLGTDFITGLKNYYGFLLIFKKQSIWKLSFIYDQVAAAFVPKLELQSGNYGACSRTAVTWVENDIWFFTGREVRSIGFKDQQTGVLGVNKSIISDQIKETLYTISNSNYDSIAVFYHNRRFYLSVPIDSSNNDTIFVCHLLYKNTWTKYNDRIKANITDFIEVDNVIYTSKSITPYGTIKWDNTLLNDNGVAISCEVYFKQNEDPDFNRFLMYRYLDLMFKNLTGTITVTIKQDANDLRTNKTNTFYIGTGLNNMLSTIGEVGFGSNLVADGFGQNIENSPVIKKRISFLSKSQALTIGLSNSNKNETFTINEYILSGFKEPEKMFNPSSIVSVN